MDDKRGFARQRRVRHLATLALAQRVAEASAVWPPKDLVISIQPFAKGWGEISRDCLPAYAEAPARRAGRMRAVNVNTRPARSTLLQKMFGDLIPSMIETYFLLSARMQETLLLKNERQALRQAERLLLIRHLATLALAQRVVKASAGIGRSGNQSTGESD